MKTIGVTGSTGMIGKILCGLLAKSGYKVKQMGKLRVENLGDVMKFAKGVGGIIHLAAKINLSYDKDEFYKTNVLGSRNIASVAWKKNIRLINVSTIMVFEDSRGKLRDEGWIKRVTSKNNYIRTKIEANIEVKKNNPKAITVYPCVVIDRDMYKKDQIGGSGLAYWVWKNLGGGVPGGIMAAIGPKDRHMNIVEVNDVANGILLAWKKGMDGDNYILGGQNIEVEKYLDILNRRRIKWRIPEWPFKILSIMPVPKMIKNMCLSVGGDMWFDSDKAKRVLGYRPEWKLR